MAYCIKATIEYVKVCFLCEVSPFFLFHPTKHTSQAILQRFFFCFREHTERFQGMIDMLAHLWENKSHINCHMSLPSP